MKALERIARVDLPDVTLAVESRGQGPIVIAAHGFPDVPSTFRAQVPALVEAGYRVVVPAMRGYAPSGLSMRGRYDLAALGGDLLALADRFSPEAPVRILGHDWGAAAGFAAAALAPHRISHLAALAVPHLRAFLRATWRSSSSAAWPSARCAPATWRSSIGSGATGRRATWRARRRWRR